MTVKELMDRLNEIPEENRNAEIVIPSGNYIVEPMDDLYFEMDECIVSIGGIPYRRKVCKATTGC